MDNLIQIETITKQNISGKVPGTTIGLLTNTSKMPCQSWSIPAVQSCPFAVFGENAICDACYARPQRPVGRPTLYNMSNVKKAQAARFSWVRRCMKSDKGKQEFVAVMVDAISKSRKEYFRIHDSGDFFSEAYTRCWIEIAKKLPNIKFWAPTRSHKAEWVQALIDLNSLPNVTVKPSAYYFDEMPPNIKGLAAGSGVKTKDGEIKGKYSICPAYKQGGKCGDCRTCWDSPKTVVMYKAH